MLDFEIQQEIMPVIQVNFEEMKEALSQTMDQYKGIIVTEESLSACKAEQKHLAGMRTKIDNYRKDKKKELSKPITDFENQCKELIGLIEKAEQPIKEGISVFDNQKKEEKRQKALEIIQEAVETHQLKPKFADKLNILDKYMNLTATTKAVKEDVEQRAFMLAEEQAREEESIQIIKTTIENENKTLKTQIQYEEFEKLIENGYPIPQIMQRISQIATKIREAEKPKAEEPKVEIPTPDPEPVCSAPTPEEPRFYVTFKVTGTGNQTRAIGNFLRSNGIQYELLDQGRL